MSNVRQNQDVSESEHIDQLISRSGTIAIEEFPGFLNEIYCKFKTLKLRDTYKQTLLIHLIDCFKYDRALLVIQEMKKHNEFRVSESNEVHRYLANGTTRFLEAYLDEFMQDRLQHHNRSSDAEIGEYRKIWNEIGLSTLWNNVLWLPLVQAVKDAPPIEVWMALMDKAKKLGVENPVFDIFVGSLSLENTDILRMALEKISNDQLAKFISLDRFQQLDNGNSSHIYRYRNPMNDKKISLFMTTRESLFDLALNQEREDLFCLVLREVASRNDHELNLLTHNYLSNNSTDFYYAFIRQQPVHISVLKCMIIADFAADNRIPQQLFREVTEDVTDPKKIGHILRCFDLDSMAAKTVSLTELLQEVSLVFHIQHLLSNESDPDFKTSIYKKIASAIVQISDESYRLFLSEFVSLHHPEITAFLAAVNAESDSRHALHETRTKQQKMVDAFFELSRKLQGCISLYHILIDPIKFEYTSLNTEAQLFFQSRKPAPKNLAARLQEKVPDWKPFIKEKLCTYLTELFHPQNREFRCDPKSPSLDTWGIASATCKLIFWLRGKAYAIYYKDYPFVTPFVIVNQQGYIVKLNRQEQFLFRRRVLRHLFDGHKLEDVFFRKQAKMPKKFWDDWHETTDAGNEYQRLIHPVMTQTVCTILQEMTTTKPPLVLEICGGQGELAERILQQAKRKVCYILAENNNSALNTARKRLAGRGISIVNVDIINDSEYFLDADKRKPIKPGSVDIALGSGALTTSVLKDKREALMALQKLVRYLKRGGYLVLSGHGSSLLEGIDFVNHDLQVINRSIPLYDRNLYILRKHSHV
jgi:hypothetical protein